MGKEHVLAKAVVDLSVARGAVGRRTFYTCVKHLSEASWAHLKLIVLSDGFQWDNDGVEILGSVPINLNSSFLQFPLHKRSLKYLRRTTSTAM